MANALKTAIETAAAQPRTAAVRGMRVQHHSLKDLVAAAYYLDGLTTQELFNVPATPGSESQIPGVKTGQFVPGPTFRVV